MLGLPDLQRILRGERLVYGVRVGSWVYGVARPDSDTDFVAVIAGVPRDRLLFGRNSNVTVYEPPAFQQALDDCTLYALEALWAPAPHRLVDHTWPWTPDRERIRTRALEKSQDDWAKGVRLLRDGDPEKGAKKVGHSLRVLLFGRQLLERGRIDDFEAGKEIHLDLFTSPEVEVERWDLLRTELRAALGDRFRHGP